MVAPADGYPTNVQLRPGSFTTAFPITPAMTFVEEKYQVIALFHQNELQLVEEGNEALYLAMVQGLRAPQRIETELMHTYAASKLQAFWLLRMPSALPYLFPSLRVAIVVARFNDLVTDTEIREALAHVCTVVWDRAAKKGARGRTVTLKLRYADFRTITRAKSVASPILDGASLLAAGEGRHAVNHGVPLGKSARKAGDCNAVRRPYPIRHVACADGPL